MDVSIGAALIAKAIYSPAKRAVYALRGKDVHGFHTSGQPNFPVVFDTTSQQAAIPQKRRRFSTRQRIAIGITAAAAINWGTVDKGNLIARGIDGYNDNGLSGARTEIASAVSNGPVIGAVTEHLKEGQARRTRDARLYEFAAGERLYHGEAGPQTEQPYFVNALPDFSKDLTNELPGWYAFHAKRIETETQIPWYVTAGFQMTSCSDGNDWQAFAQCLTSANENIELQNQIIGNMQLFAENLSQRAASTPNFSEDGLYQHVAHMLKELEIDPSQVKRIFGNAEVLLVMGNLYERYDLNYAVKSPHLVEVGGTYVDESIAPAVKSIFANSTTDGIELTGLGWIPIDDVRNQRLACMLDPAKLDWDHRVYLIWGASAEEFSQTCGVAPVSRPGQGLHMFGRAIDFTCVSDSEPAFGKSECAEWLKENSTPGNYPNRNIGDLEFSPFASWELSTPPIERVPIVRSR